MIEEKVAIVDPDVRRRCAVARYFYDHALHVEPFESFEELRLSWPQVGLLLVHYDESGLREVFETMVEREGWVPTVVYSSEPDPAQIVDAVLMGAMDFLAWPFSADHLKARLRILMKRRRSFAELRRKATKAQSLVKQLSRREKDVLFSLASGRSNKLIAQKLEISPRTVEIHRANMMGKLGANHMSEAISIALYAGFNEQEEEQRASEVALQ